MNRMVLFAVTKPLGSLMCMCPGFWADSLTLVVTSELRQSPLRMRGNLEFR